MGRGLLCALVLLLSLGAVSQRQKGEWCRAWMYGMELSTRVFQCPKKLDEAEAKFCCGTCSFPYCCSSKETRLNQAQCSAELKARAFTVAPKKRHTPSKTSQELLNIVWFGMGASSFVIICRWACYYGSKFWKWLKGRPRRTTQQGALMGSPSPVIMETPLPYGNYWRTPGLPPYRDEDPRDSWLVQFHRSNCRDPEGEVEILSPTLLAARTAPDRTLEEEMEPALEEELII